MMSASVGTWKPISLLTYGPLSGQLVPPAHVCNPVLIAGYNNLGVPRQGFAVFTARATRVPRPCHGKQDLAGTSSANRADDPPQRSHAIEVRRIEFAIVLH